ncbi:MAG: hypothetical protein U1F11_12690 [Steroidobacteraceae bacterium]
MLTCASGATPAVCTIDTPGVRRTKSAARSTEAASRVAVVIAVMEAGTS